MKILKELRAKKGAYQKDVAKYLGIDRTTYVKYELGDSEPNLENLSKIADYFEVSTDYLLNRKSNDVRDKASNSFSDKEKKLVAAYRNKPEMQSAIDKLLGLDDKVIQMDQPEKTYKIRSVARGGHITEFELDEQGLKDLEEAIKKTDASDL